MKTPKTREEADALLKRKGEIALALKANEVWLNRNIQKLTESANAAAQPWLAEDAKITDALHKFLLAERPHLGKARSLTLNFGRIGFRARNAVEYVRGWKPAGIIQALKSYGLQQFIRVSESIKRQAIKDEKDAGMKELLLKCGVRVQPGDTFFAEPDLKALADYQQKGEVGAGFKPARSA